MDAYSFVDYDYGKGAVKLIHIRKDGPFHTVRELEVATKLTLNTIKEYTHGDNSDIVATDTQKNAVYVLAKKHGVTTPEEFGMLLCRHFLNTYDHVTKAKAIVQLYPWQRITVGGREHNHAFIFNPSAIRTAIVFQKRNDLPKVSASLTNLRILKTTQASFSGFHRDEYRTLPDAEDRLFSTIVEANWDYSTTKVNFDSTWNHVKEVIIAKFAGPADKGLLSPNVQNIVYLAEKAILDDVKEISSIEMTMPNKHYLIFDFSKFPEKLTKGAANEEVVLPTDLPSGVIRARMARNDSRSKL